MKFHTFAKPPTLAASSNGILILKAFLMKHTIFILVILSFFGCQIHHRSVYDESNYVLIKTDTFNGSPDREIYVYKYDTSRKLLINYWGNGKLMVKGFYHNNKPDGIRGFYDIAGKLLKLDSFVDGTKLVSKEFFTPDTSVKIFKNGKLEPFKSVDSLK